MGNTYGTTQEKNNVEIISDKERYNMLIKVIRHRCTYIKNICSPKFMDDKRFVMSLLEIGNVTFDIEELSPRLQNDREVLNTALQKGCEVYYPFRDKIFQDREYTISYLKGVNCRVVYYKELGEFKNDRNFALEILNYNPNIYEYMPMKCRDEIQITYEAVKRNGRMIDYASERLRKNEDLIKLAVETNIHALLYASDNLTDDYVFMKQIIKKNIASMSYASDRLKDNYAFVKELMIDNPLALNYASKRLINNKELLEIALKDENNNSYIIFENISIDNILYFKDNILKRLKDYPKLIKLDTINDNYEIMIEYVKLNPHMLHIASKRLINDMRFLKSVLDDKDSDLSKISSRITLENVLLFKDSIIKRIVDKPSLFAHLNDTVLKDKVFMQQMIETVPVISKYFNQTPDILLDQQTVESKIKRRNKT